MNIEKKFKDIDKLNKPSKNKINYSKTIFKTQYLNKNTSKYNYNTLQAFFSETSSHWFSELKIKAKFVLDGKLTESQETQLNSLNDCFTMISQIFAKNENPTMYVAKHTNSIHFILNIEKSDLNEKTPDVSKLFHPFMERIIIKRDKYIFNLTIENFFLKINTTNDHLTLNLDGKTNV